MASGRGLARKLPTRIFIEKESRKYLDNNDDNIITSINITNNNNNDNNLNDT